MHSCFYNRQSLGPWGIPIPTASYQPVVRTATGRTVWRWVGRSKGTLVAAQSVVWWEVENARNGDRLPALEGLQNNTMRLCFFSNNSMIILDMGSANERGCYFVTSSLIGWTHTQNDHCSTGLGSNTYLYLQIQIQIQIRRICICIWSNFKPCICICIWSTVFGVFDKYVFKYTFSWAVF